MGWRDISGCLRPQAASIPRTEGFGSFQTRLMIVIARGHQGPWLTDHAISQSRATVWSSVSSPCPLSIRPTHPPHAPAKTLPIVPRGARRKVDDGFRPGPGECAPGSPAPARLVEPGIISDLTWPHQSNCRGSDGPSRYANGHWTIPSRQMQRYPTRKSPAVVGTRTNTRRAAYGRCSC